MAKYIYDPREWEDDVSQDEVEDVYQAVIGNGVQVKHLYTFPKGKIGTYKILIAQYNIWAKQETNRLVYLPVRGWTDRLWNSSVLNEDISILSMPLLQRHAFSMIMAERVAALAVTLLSSVQLKKLTNWSSVLTAVNQAVMNIITSRVIKQEKSRIEADWKYISSRHVPVVYRYTRLYERTGCFLSSLRGKSEVPLLLITKAVYKGLVVEYRDVLVRRLIGRHENLVSEMVLHMSIPGAWENLSLCGVDPIEPIMSGYRARSANVKSVLEGGSTSFLTGIASVEEVEYFNTNWNHEGRFVFLPGEDSCRATEVLARSSHPNWCTSTGGPGPYRLHPFLIVMENSSPIMAIRWMNGEVKEIQSPTNNGEVTHAMKQILVARVIPNLDDESAHALCDFLDKYAVTKEWVTDPTPVDQLFADFKNDRYDVLSNGQMTERETGRLLSDREKMEALFHR